jgi:hypothetical protein
LHEIAMPPPIIAAVIPKHPIRRLNELLRSANH